MTQALAALGRADGVGSISTPSGMAHCPVERILPNDTSLGSNKTQLYHVGDVNDSYWEMPVPVRNEKFTVVMQVLRR
jgi:hypothetical protein